MTLQERTDLWVDRYGEVCTKTKAGHILSRDPRSISRMIKDGRLEGACGGTMVDVRSMAAFAHQPEEISDDVRKRRIQLKYNSEFAV